MDLVALIFSGSGLDYPRKKINRSMKFRRFKPGFVFFIRKVVVYCLHVVPSRNCTCLFVWFLPTSYDIFLFNTKNRRKG